MRVSAKYRQEPVSIVRTLKQSRGALMILVTVRVLQGFSMGFQRRGGAFFRDCPLVGVGDTKGDGPYRGAGFPTMGRGIPLG